MSHILVLELKMKTLELHKLKAYSAYQRAELAFLAAENEYLTASVAKAAATAEQLEAEVIELEEIIE